MRVSKLVKIIISLIILVVLFGAFCLREEQKTRDNATHLLLLRENQQHLKEAFNNLKYFKEKPTKYVLSSIDLSYKEIKKNIDLLKNGGNYRLGQTSQNIGSIYYEDIKKNLDKIDLLTVAEIHKIEKLMLQDSFYVSKSTQRLLTDDNLDLKRMTAKFVRLYYDKNTGQGKIAVYGVWASFGVTFILILYIYFVIYRKVLVPSYNFNFALENTSKREEALEHSKNTLFNDVGIYLGNLEKELNQATHFIKEVGNGNFDLSLEGDTKLFTALKRMQKNLKHSYKEQQRNAWGSAGLAKLGEIIRHNTDNIETLSNQILKMVVAYTHCQQGALYLKKKGIRKEDHLELLNHYGLSTKGYDNEIIYEGEGLVGEVLLKPRTTYVTDLPDSYIIMSGIGEAKPTSLLIIPLITNQGELIGVLELMSFAEMKKHEVALVEQMGESIATSLFSVSNSHHTEQLLVEAQDLTKKLRSQEEYMRTNMKDLREAQAEMVRNQIELEGVFKSIDQTLGTIEVDMDKNILSTNQMILDILGYDDDELEQKSFSEVLLKGTSIEEYMDSIWTKIVNNESVTGDYQCKNKRGEGVWLNMTITPVKNQLDEIFKVIVLAKDVTQRKEEELEIQRLSLVADTTDNAIIIVNRHGFIEYINPGFTKTSGYAELDVLGAKPGEFLFGEKTNEIVLESINSKLQLEVSFVEEVLLYRKDNSTYWATLSVNPVFNENNSLEKHIYLLADITETKTSELDYSYKMNAISHSNAMFELDLDGNVVSTNDNFLKIVGYSSDELLTTSYLNLIPKAEQKKFEDLFTVICKGEFIDGEYQRLNKLGDILWIREVYNPIFDLDDNVIKVIVFTVDITQEKKLEVVSEEKDLELKEHSKAVNKTIASVEFDMEGNILGANDIFLGVFGYSLDELLGQHESILMADGMNKQHTLMWENLKVGKFFEGEFQNVGKNKHPIWLKGTYNPIFNRQGKPYKIKMLAQFTTDEKEREVSLNSVVNAVKSSFMYIELNTDLTIRQSNSLFLSFIGYKRMELRKMSISQLMVSFEGDDLMEIFKSGKPITKKFSLQTKEKKLQEFECYFHPVKDLQNQINKIIVFLI